MTVSGTLVYAELNWTGAETAFDPGIEVLQAAHAVVTFRPAAGDDIPLIRGVHFASIRTLEGTLRLTPIALPPAPGMLLIERRTPATQTADFQTNYGPEVHQALHDAAALRDQENAWRAGRALVVAPGSDPLLVPETVGASGKWLQFYEDRLRWADPEDVGFEILQQVETLRDEAADEADAAAGERVGAEAARDMAAGFASAASASASLLGNPDYGFITAAPIDARDYGSIV